MSSSPLIVKDAQLSEYTTFQLGGPCDGLITCDTPASCENAVAYLNKEKLPFILIGGGSNLVVSDQGLTCYVIRYVSDAPIFTFDQTEVTVSGSTNLDIFVKVLAQTGMGGLNYASGIPGTVGGAVVGNAGAFGRQIGDIVKSVTLLSKEGIKRSVTADEITFTYRHSTLKENDDIVLDVTLMLELSDREILLQEREEILDIRREKHPNLVHNPCAGSFFRNIEPTSDADRRQATGWFLDQAGGKALYAGGAHIYDKHANIIIKGDNCTSEDVYALSIQMANLVEKKHGLTLVREVRFVGAFDQKPKDITDVIW